MHRRIEIAPSILPADFARLGQECIDLENAGVDRIHWDVMDGVFVPNITMGPDIVKSLRSHLTIPFEAHLMVVKADEIAPLFIEAGCSTVMVHVEACTHLHRSLNNIRSHGARAGSGSQPSHTGQGDRPRSRPDRPHLGDDSKSGFGGQKYIRMLDKISEIKAMVDSSGYEIDIEVDGGISAETIGECAGAGANVFVSGSALFKYEDRTAGTAELRCLAEAARN